MTAIDTTRTAHSTHTFFGHIGQSFTGIKANISAWNELRVTRNSLYKLSERQLEDIGMCRGDIENFNSGR